MRRLPLRALLLALALARCAPPRRAEGMRCHFSDECASPLLCVAERCRAPCRTDRDCLAGYSCVPTARSGISVCLPNGEATPCAANDDCPSDLTCSAGASTRLCVRPCVADLQCADLEGAWCTGQGWCSVAPSVGLQQRYRGLADAAAEGAPPLDSAPTDTPLDARSADASPDGEAGPSDTAEATALDAGMDAARDVPNPCDASLADDPRNCGLCGHRCSAQPNAAAACVAGACAIRCAATYGDCDLDPSNGCEADLRTPARCGACGVSCGPSEACAGTRCVATDAGAADGSLVLSADAGAVLTLPAGRHVYDRVDLPAGVTLRVAGDGVLELYATDTITIAGTIDVSGGAGGYSLAGGCSLPGGQGGETGTGAPGTAPTATCPPPAAGGRGLPGGVGAPYTGAPATPACMTGGAFGGGTGGSVNSGGGGGGGYAGGGGAASAPGTTGGAGAQGPREQGGAGAASATLAGRGAEPSLGFYAGRDGVAGCNASYGGGGGGGSIGRSAAEDLAVSATFQPGSGGGGGGGVVTTCSTFGGTGAGAGGGGGGGVLRLSAGNSLRLESTARLLANGGPGGTPDPSSPQAGGGGGGSGGLLYLSAPRVEVAAGAVLSARGGIGGGRYDLACNPLGGAGGHGRIRVAALPERCSLSGVFFPPLRAGCAPSPSAGEAGFTFVSAYPP